MNTQTIRKRDTKSSLVKALLIHLVLISLVTVAGVFGAAKVVENVLIKEALNGEAEFFWHAYEQDNNFPLPKTMNLTGYFESSSERLPSDLLEMTEDFQRVKLNAKEPIVYRTKKYGKTLYLVFEEAQVSRLALYFGIAPLVLVLLVIYLPAFISYMMAKRAVSPLIKIVRKIEQIDISKAGLEEINFDDVDAKGNLEVISLVKSFEEFSARIAQFVERERNFSRYASHELRTPLTVFKISLSSLEKQGLDQKSQRIVNRLIPVVDEMSELIDALLMLSREQQFEISEEPIVLNDVLKHVVDQMTVAFSDKQITVKWELNQLLAAHVPEQVFQIVISNLLRNAFLYSHENGQVVITIGEGKIKIRDQGIGMDEKQLSQVFQPFYRANEYTAFKGLGLGLTIVDWLSQQYGWVVTFESEPGVGTEVTLMIDGVSVLANKS